MSDHYHYGYADDRHDHDLDYAEKWHRHYDLEREDERLHALIRGMGETLNELRNDLQAALERIRALEGDTPQARQLQLEADQAAADLAASGYDRHGRDCGCPYCADEDDRVRYEEELAREGMETGMSATERAEYDQMSEAYLDAAEEARDRADEDGEFRWLP